MVLDLNGEEINRISIKIRMLHVLKNLHTRNKLPNLNSFCLDLFSLYEGGFYYNANNIFIGDIFSEVISSMHFLDSASEKTKDAVLSIIKEECLDELSAEMILNEIEDSAYVICFDFEELKYLINNNVDIDNHVRKLENEISEIVDIEMIEFLDEEEFCFNFPVYSKIKDGKLFLLVIREWFSDIDAIESIDYFVSNIVEKYKGETNE